MLVNVCLAVELEIEVDDKYREIDTPQTAIEFFTDDLCDECCREVCEKISMQYPELSGLPIKEIYSSEDFNTLYKYF